MGYDTEERKLIVNKTEAKVVRHIFQRYTVIGSVRELKNELDADGVVSKIRCSKNGRRTGGVPLARGALYLMLQNRIYLGEIVHKDKSYPGEQDAIIEKALWDTVQAKLSANRVEQKTGGAAKEPSLFAGLLHDEHGHHLTPSHANKNGKRYRYYISRSLTTGNKANAPTARRIPAGEIEGLVIRRIRDFLGDRAEAFEAISQQVQNIAEQKRLTAHAADLTERWEELSPAEVRSILLAFVARIEIHEERIDITVNTARIADVLQNDPMDLSQAIGEGQEADRLTISVPAKLKRTGLGIKMIIDGPDGRRGNGRVDPSLARLIVKGHVYRDKLIKGKGASLSDIASSQNVTRSYFTRLVRLTFLAPDIIRAILEGRHPPMLTAAKLSKASRLPLTWPEQQEVLGFN